MDQDPAVPAGPFADVGAAALWTDLIRRLQEIICIAEAPHARGCLLGIGDDAAVFDPPAGRQVVVCTDSLVESVHFHAETSAASIGHKALAVNLSDLAAMGAEPAWATLSVTFPAIDEAWLAAFMQGFSALAARHDIQLVGGDTTKGPQAFTLQAQGFIEPGRAMLRSGARPGDAIYVTGTLGAAGAALAAFGPEFTRHAKIGQRQELVSRRITAIVAAHCRHQA